MHVSSVRNAAVIMFQVSADLWGRRFVSFRRHQSHERVKVATLRSQLGANPLLRLCPSAWSTKLIGVGQIGLRFLSNIQSRMSTWSPSRHTTAKGETDDESQ